MNETLAGYFYIIVNCLINKCPLHMMTYIFYR